MKLNTIIDKYNLPKVVKMIMQSGRKLWDKILERNVWEREMWTVRTCLVFSAAGNLVLSWFRGFVSGGYPCPHCSENGQKKFFKTDLKWDPFSSKV